MHDGREDLRKEVDMLRRIPAVLSSDQTKILPEIEHRGEVALADSNFLAVTCARRLIRCDERRIPVHLEGVLRSFPLDSKVEAPVSPMALGVDDPFSPVI